MLIEVAKLGKAVGLKGFLKLHHLTDFPEQFKKESAFETRAGRLVIETISDDKSEVKFSGVDSREEASKLTNLILHAQKDESEKECELGDDEYFWYDIVGLSVYENDIELGFVKEIERYPLEDHLLIITSSEIEKNKKIKRFLLPYNKKTILDVDLENNRIIVKGALEIIDVISS